MEFQFENEDLYLPSKIYNLEQLKAELIPKLDKYNTLVVTEESIKAAKADRAALNKLKTVVNDQRIAAKKQYLEPFERLENQCKELVSLIDAPIQAIDKQIKAFDEIEKQEKYEALEQAFAALDTPEWIKIEDVLNPKWGNKGEKLDSLKAEMSELAEKMIADLDKLMEMYKDFPHKLAIEQKYKECKDFSKTAVYAAELNTQYQAAQRKAEEARERELKQQMLQAAEEKEATENVQNTPQQPEPEQSAIIPPEPQTAVNVESGQPEPMLKGKFAVECENSQWIALRDFMNSQGIKFELAVECTELQLRALGGFMKAQGIKFVIVK